MALVTCNGEPVLGLRLSLPRVGAWVADVEIASDAGLRGPVSIQDGTLEWTGTALRSGVFAGRTQARIVGAIGLRQVLSAKSYVGVALKAVATDILSGAGEALAASSQKSTLATPLSYWTRMRVSAGAALGSLLASANAGWRVEPTGRVWLGIDSFPIQKFEHHELTRNDALGTALIACESLELRPGVTFDGRRVSRVEHSIDGGSLRSSYWFEP